MPLIIFYFFGILASNNWLVLADVHFKTTFRADLDTYVDVPRFGEKLQALNGQTIQLKGYFLPMELEDPKAIILSKNPYASCFFCGGAGLESVVEVHFAHTPTHFKPDEVITIEGKLQLNKDDFEHLIYIIKDAKRLVWEDR